MSASNCRTEAQEKIKVEEKVAYVDCNLWDQKVTISVDITTDERNFKGGPMRLLDIAPFGIY